MAEDALVVVIDPNLVDARPVTDREPQAFLGRTMVISLNSDTLF